MFRLGVIIGAALLLATGAAFQARASGGQRLAVERSVGAATPFTNIRVCGTDKIPYKGDTCKRDGRRGGLVFREIDCSVRVTVKKQSSFVASILYEGNLQYIAHTRLKRGKHNELVGVRVSPTKMPGGRYTCSFRLGEALTKVRFETKGPHDRFLGPRVCVTPARKNGICQRDAAGSPIVSPRSMMCGGVFVGFAGKTWGAKLVRQTKTSPVLVGQYGARHLPGPISEQWISFKSKTAVGIFRPAKYSCLFYANGKQVAEHSFTITAKT